MINILCMLTNTFENVLVQGLPPMMNVYVRCLIYRSSCTPKQQE